ncbi:MAG: protease-like protein [Frankiales bacterium]|nr:protease-like protein [Frankiales bacterium]
MWRVGRSPSADFRHGCLVGVRAPRQGNLSPKGQLVLRLRTALAALVTLTLATSSLPASASPQRQSRPICAAPSGRLATCSVVVVTDIDGTPFATSSYATGLRPADIRAAYAVSTSTTTATVAVIGAYFHPAAAANLATYRTQFGLGTAHFSQVSQAGRPVTPTTGGPSSWGAEEMLDLQMVSAVCPSCSLLYVGANSASLDDLATAVDTAAALGATVITNSYGVPEFSGEMAYAAHYDHPGVTIVASSGDSGYGVQVPAAFPTVTAVGGTTLVTDSAGARLNETAWSGSGSGCSAYVPKPSWQRDAACKRRTVVDIAAVADPDTGVATYNSYGAGTSGGWTVVGGTSVATPLIAALYAVGGAGPQANASRLYAAPATSVFDVVEGSHRPVREGSQHPAHIPVRQWSRLRRSYWPWCAERHCGLRGGLVARLPDAAEPREPSRSTGRHLLRLVWVIARPA